MGFKYQDNRDYYLIPRHSGLAMGIHYNDAKLGRPLEQQSVSATAGQHIRFQPVGLNLYAPILRRSDQAVTVHAGLTTVHAPVVQWANEGQPHQWWRPVYWGEGYYHLLSAKSNLALEIPGSTGGPAQFQQNTLQWGAANQLFRIVPVVDHHMPSVTTFRQYSDLLRDATLGLSGLIPEVGGGIKAVLGVLWADGHDQDFWNQMTAYVNERIRIAIEKAKLSELKNLLEGGRTNMRYLVRTPDTPGDLPQKAQKLTSLISLFVGLQPQFLEQPTVEEPGRAIKVLPYLTAWATLTLTAQTELVKNFRKLYPTGTDAALEAEKQILRDEIQIFQDNIAALRTRAMADRLALVEQKHTGGSSVYEIWNLERLTDGFPHWEMKRRYGSYPKSGGQKWGDWQAKARINYAWNGRRSQVQAQFNAELDAILAPTRTWRFLDPAVTDRPTSEKETRVVGPYGCDPGNVAFETVHEGTLKKLTLWRQHDKPHIVGLRLTYTDGTILTRGKETSSSEELELRDGEHFSNAYGRFSNVIDSIILDTSQGRTLSIQHDSRNEYSVDYQAGLDDALPKVRLKGLSGTLADDVLRTLSFHWEYEWTYQWTTTALRATTDAERASAWLADEPADEA